MLNLNLIKNSTVLVRVNYDLPSLSEIDRIQDSLKTICTLIENKNGVIVASHWGRPKGKFIPEMSTQKLVEIINNIFKSSENKTLNSLHIQYINQFQSFSETAENIKNTFKLDKNTIFLLENTRFHPMEQSKNSEDRLNVAKQYTILADEYVDEAFPVSHRQEATNCEIKILLPDCLGVSYENEITNLNKLKEYPKQPFYAVMAGSKLETKLPLISGMIQKVDKIFLGGMLCFTFIKAYKELAIDLEKLPDIFDSSVEYDFLPHAKELILKYPDKILIPLDFVFEETNGKKMAMDIGPKTIKYYLKQLQNAKTIFWNGTMGYYEKPPFNRGTLEIAGGISKMKGVFRVIGGGDTNSALPKEITSTFDFVSMGGGATLDYLSK